MCGDFFSFHSLSMFFYPLINTSDLCKRSPMSSLDHEFTSRRVMIRNEMSQKQKEKIISWHVWRQFHDVWWELYEIVFRINTFIQFSFRACNKTLFQKISPLLEYSDWPYGYHVGYSVVCTWVFWCKLSEKHSFQNIFIFKNPFI